MLRQVAYRTRVRCIPLALHASIAQAPEGALSASVTSQGTDRPAPRYLLPMTDPTAPAERRRPLRIAQVAPPLEPVPPAGYGGTERIIEALVRAQIARGHDVTLFASGDSTASASRLVPTVPRALRPAGTVPDPWSGYMIATEVTALRHAGEFDVIHAHLEWAGLLLARASSVPVVNTFHGRLDQPFAADAFADPPAGLVAISHSQASSQPDLPWTIVYNGLDLAGAPFEARPGDALCFVGRVAPEKGIVEAIEVARRAGRRLRIAAKVGVTASERAYHEEVFLPATRTAEVELLGELSSTDRDRLFAESYATLMPGSWPEPFGLVAIESLACGTPVLALPSGALPETIRDGVDGFLGPDAGALAAAVPRVAELDRAAIRASVLDRFSAARMAAGYEAVYRRVIAGADRERGAGRRDASRPLVDEDRQREPELGAAGRPRPGPDAAAHRLDEGAADEQPDPGAGGLGGRGRRSVVELEEPPGFGR
ncbi:MAG: glycosyltransferase family 4 protein [Chloroflexi bacterium]|nr:MAG: glycosyltransferase family 4 protein [Chloroflexota bacterium]